MLFVMKELAGLDDIAALPGGEDANLETAQAVLEEAARFCGEVLAPLNVEGDRHPSSWHDGNVTSTPVSATRSASSPQAAGKACSTPSITRARACRN